MPEKLHHLKALNGPQADMGHVVRVRRLHMGLSRDELASISKVEPTEILGLELGKGTVTLQEMMSLAEALHVTVGRLLDRSEALNTDLWRFSEDFPAGDRTRDILIIEDNPTDVALTQRAFLHAGITNPVVVAGKAEEGLDYLFGKGSFCKKGPGKPQFIVLDLNLPGMSGIEFLRRVKGYPSTLNFPVIVLTASRSDMMIRECGKLGAESYIVKPLSIRSRVRPTPELIRRTPQEAWV